MTPTHASACVLGSLFLICLVCLFVLSARLPVPALKQLWKDDQEGKAATNMKHTRRRSKQRKRVREKTRATAFREGMPHFRAPSITPIKQNIHPSRVSPYEYKFDFLDRSASCSRFPLFPIPHHQPTTTTVASNEKEERKKSKHPKQEGKS